MRSIAEFFKNIKSRQARTAHLRAVVQEAVEKHAHISVPLEAIDLSVGTAVLRGLGQTAKSVIFIKKPAIMEEIKARLDNGAIVDIRLGA
jgi:hypothetical protein